MTDSAPSAGTVETPLSVEHPLDKQGDAGPVADDSVHSSVDAGGLLGQTDAGWLVQVGLERVSLAEDESPKSIAAQVAQLLRAASNGNSRCVLGLNSNECFFADIDLSSTIDPKDRSAITFELERHFPLDAEAMVADFVVHPSGRRISAFAIETDRHREVVSALEAAGIEVVSIIPMTLLIARAVQQWRDNKSAFQLCLFESDSAESIVVDGDIASQWKRFSITDNGLARHQAVSAGTDDPPREMVALGCTELPFKPTVPVQWCNQEFSTLAADAASLSLRGRWGRWPDLRRGDLAPSDPLFAVAGPLRLLALAVTLCCVVISVAASYRSDRISRESDSVRQQQRDEFSAAYPGRRVPVMLMRTVRSEHSKAIGSRGGDDAIKIPIPATTVLQHLYQGLQDAQQSGKARFRLTDVNVLDGECSFTVRAKDAVQIGTIAKSLESIGFDVSPPASDQIDPSKDEPVATYQSTIVAIWNPSNGNSAQQVSSTRNTAEEDD